MTMMSLRIILIVVYFLIFYAACKDLSRAKLGRKSNKVLVQYEGTFKEVKDYGSSLGLEFKTKVFEDWYVFTIPKETDPLAPIDVPDLHVSLSKEKKRDKRVKFIQQERYLSRRTRSLTINDREWLNQWYLQPTQTPSLNVYNAWEKGYTGKGITVMIVDDGIDIEHQDLVQNFNSSLSYDFIADSPDPSHKHPKDGHGTSCAGIVGAVKNTDCVIGIAHEVNMGAARVVRNAEEVVITASDEALALTHKYQDIDIYSNSWGPDDNGKGIDSLPEVIQEAFELAIKKGRNGKGVIYTWASGNGGEELDNCNADGYPSSMYTISIAAVNRAGLQTYYSEACTSILAATYSGDANILDIATTGPDGTCIGDFSGTSAACPMATGIIALTLQANPDLTWRDIQHMIVEFSNFSALIHTNETHADYEYYKNGAGKQVSIWSGFGLMDAMAMVDNAPTWSTVPPRLSCTSGDLYVNIVSDKQANLYHEFNNCPIKYLEHVEVTVFYNSTYRGRVAFYLLSPMGTESKIFPTRYYDNSSDHVYHTFMSVHTWGEDPNGLWYLIMYAPYEEVTEMHLYEWKLDVFGTATDPLAGIPPEGTFGSPCNTSSLCTSLENGGCLIDSDEMCDNICISCKNGYHFNGDYCEKDCPPLSAVDDGYVEVSSESGLMVAKYTCYYEFGAVLGAGDETRTCGSDGIWTGKEPTCDLVDCGSPAEPDNGIVNFDDTVFDYYATYECDEGYAISEGDDERMCLLDGEWSGTEPTCSRDCGELTSPTNGSVVFSDTLEGSEAVYTCEEGYIISKGDARRTCQTDGTWSSDEPKCLIDCGPLNNPENGSLSLTSTTEGSNATYTCKTGFAVGSGNVSRICAPDGMWTGIPAVCITDCGSLENPANGEVSFISTTEGAEANYTCKNGFTIDTGNSLRTCDTNGDWTGTKPTCTSDEPTVATEESARLIGIVVGSVVMGVLIIVIAAVCLVLHYKRHSKSSADLGN